MPAPGACAGTYAAPAAVGKVADVALDEISGLVVSATNAGVFWVHNDSGSKALLVAINAAGKTLGAIDLTGLPWVDPEDLAIAPCPDFSGPCLWVADSGTNNGARDNLALYVVPEPPVGDLTSTAVVPDRIWQFGYEFPANEKVNSEALVVLPDLSAAYLFEKARTDTLRVFAYRPPFNLEEKAELQLVTTMAAPGAVYGDSGKLVTAADLHPTGTRLALRVYTGVYEYVLNDARQLETLGALSPVMVALGPLDEPQGEAIAYDGTRLWTVSEGVQPKLHRYDCQ